MDKNGQKHVRKKNITFFWWVYFRSAYSSLTFTTNSIKMHGICIFVPFSLRSNVTRWFLNNIFEYICAIVHKSGINRKSSVEKSTQSLVFEQKTGLASSKQDTLDRILITKQSPRRIRHFDVLFLTSYYILLKCALVCHGDVKLDALCNMKQSVRLQ